MNTATARCLRFAALSALACLALRTGAPAAAENSVTLETLYAFDGTSGLGVHSAMIVGSDGKLYGTTSDGGEGGCGAVFRLNYSGTLKVLHSFDGTDGCSPWSSVFEASDGTLYGTTMEGLYPENYGGTIFSIGVDGAFTTLETFDALHGAWELVDGLAESADGHLYGTSHYGGVGNGLVYRISPQGEYSVIHEFTGNTTTDGAAPKGQLIAGADGRLFGTTAYGGEHTWGTVYALNADDSVEIIHSFDKLNGGDVQSGLFRAVDGAMYGTTYQGGAGDCNCGTVYRIDTSGNFTLLHSFDQTDGKQPWETVAAGPDDALYGTTSSGGEHGYGTLYRITSDGEFSVLYSFSSDEGGMKALVLGADGNLYGAAGAAVYRINFTPPDTSPDPFDFPDKSGIDADVAVNSKNLTITGFDASLPVSVDGGKYRINSGEWTKEDGSIAPGDSVQLQTRSADAPGTTVTVQFTAGTFTDSWSVTTSADAMPEPFSFAPKTGVALDTWIKSAWVQPQGYDVPLGVSVQGGQYRLRAEGGTAGSWLKDPVTIVPGEEVQLRVRSADVPGTAKSVTLDIGGVTGIFTVTTTP